MSFTEAQEGELLSEIDALQRQQTVLETTIAQLALDSFNLRGRGSSAALKDLAIRLSNAQNEEIAVSATLAQKRKDLVAHLKLRRTLEASSRRHPTSLTSSTPLIEPSHSSPARSDSRRSRPPPPSPTSSQPQDGIEVAHSAARLRLLKRQSFPNPTPPESGISQERALAIRINEKAARRDERRLRRPAREEALVSVNLPLHNSHSGVRSTPPKISPLLASLSGPLSPPKEAVPATPIIPSTSSIIATATLPRDEQTRPTTSTPTSSPTHHSSDEPAITTTAKTGYQEVLSEEEAAASQTHDAYPELRKVINGIEVQYTNLRFGAPIGMGCYGEVFSAMLDGKPVAVKVMTASTTPSLRKAFVREVEALRALREHPNIVRLVGAALYPHWCIVMQLVHGGSLHDLLYARRASLTLEQALRIGRDVAEALRHLHGLKMPIIHRDVTSRNVLLQVVKGSLPPMPGPNAFARMVDAGVVYQGLLSDFGIARTKGKSRSADQLSPTGPRRFRAPEVAQKGPDGRYHYSRRVDVYMFGTVLFELLYAREPWPQDLPDDKVIARGAAGQLPNLPDTSASGQPVPQELRSVIAATWNEQPKLRPNIGAVSKLLELVARRIRPSTGSGRKNSNAPEP